MNLYLDSLRNVMAVTHRGKTFKTTPSTYKQDLPSHLAKKVNSAFRRYEKGSKGWLIVGKPDAISTR